MATGQSLGPRKLRYELQGLDEFGQCCRQSKVSPAAFGSTSGLQDTSGINVPVPVFDIAYNACGGGNKFRFLRSSVLAICQRNSKHKIDWLLKLKCAAIRDNLAEA